MVDVSKVPNNMPRNLFASYFEIERLWFRSKLFQHLNIIDFREKAQEKERKGGEEERIQSPMGCEQPELTDKMGHPSFGPTI